MEEARDLDELIVSHERYLNAIVEKSLLGNDLIIYKKNIVFIVWSHFTL